MVKIVFCQFVAALITIAFFLGFAKNSTAGEIMSVKSSGIFYKDLVVKYMDRNGDIARCTLTRDEKLMYEHETFIVAGFADFTFSISFDDDRWKNKGSYREKQKFEIACETTKYLNADHNIPKKLEHYIYHPKESIPEKKTDWPSKAEKPNTKIASSINTQSNTPTSAELEAERKKRIKLEEQLAALRTQQEQQQQTISNDTQIPLITIASANTKGKQGVIRGRASDNVGVAEVTIDGNAVAVQRNGSFEYSTFVPPTGLTVTVQATDMAGLSSKQTVSLQRNANLASATITFDRLNPIGKSTKQNSNGLALIIGVSDYENTPAKAVFADADAMMFRDYASEKLGIPDSRIKTMVNDNADIRELLLSVKNWLSRSVKQNQSDVYIFFAGHGLASDDGSKMYLLPYDGAPELLDDTAILRDRLFSDVAAANPRSVTVFLDTCYSGTTRGTDMLIASRPIAIRALEQSIPDNFTVMTAAAGDQTAKPLEEAKHGMFSYFLMKGMEGEADANNDNEITAGELHSYVQTNVIQQSSGSQTPELQGDADRVLVRFQ
ncbi:caspase family protein [Alphaproteobacteria bacterium]|nr:caspase family protein [Alphaproteobacteria bacterium]